MFELNEAQKTAFSDATNGVSVFVFSHGVVFFVGVFATVWLTLLFIGIFKKQTLSPFEALHEFGWGVLIFTLTGLLILGW